MEGELYQKVCTLENLLSAWTRIKEKGSAGGIDKVTLQTFEIDLEKNLRDLSTQLGCHRYIPEPYQEIKIPKDDNEFRSLSLPTIKDKIVQQCVRDIIEPSFEKEFLDVSYAYRQHKGPARAIARVSHLIFQEKREWVTLCDIDSYFDTIPHENLFSLLREKINDESLLTLIRIWVKMGKVDAKMRWKDTVRGIPQGAILSPLLSNLYLHPFDKIMVEKTYGFVRYADDFVILSHKEEEAYRALKDATWFIEKYLKLNLNPGSSVKKVQEGFEFLGILFRGSEKTITTEKEEELRNRINGAIDLKEIPALKTFTETLQGIGRYYGCILPENILEGLDNWTVDCLKRHLNDAYRKGILKKKEEIENLLSCVNFFSKEHQLFRKRDLKGIVTFCSRRREKMIEGETQRTAQRDPVKKRKKEYQKLESEGFELVVNTPGVFVGKTKKGITIKERGIKKYEAPLLNLKNISILSRGVTISSNVIEYCAERGIPVDFVGFQGKPYAKIYPFRSALAYLGVAQLKAFENGKAHSLARSFVSGKIRNQINLAKYYHKYRKGRDEDFTAIFDEKITLMESLSKEARTVHDNDIGTLRGKLFSIEGRVSACYWELVEKMLNEDVDFDGRVRRGAKDLVNSLLNYGYGILYSRIWEAILKAGLNPCISYLHTPQNNEPTLTYDLIEEFRQQAVDRPVFALITKGEELRIEKEKLTDETRKKVAGKVLERINTVEVFRAKETRLSQVMKEQAKALGEFLEDKLRLYRPYVGKW